MTANVFPDNGFAVRGQSITPYNNHVLFLLDGRPLRDPVTGGLNGLILTAFPIDTIEQIEIVRGPGLVLCGSLAYSAVVKIVTKEPAEDEKWTELKIGGGSFGTCDARVSTVFGSENFQLVAGVQGLTSVLEARPDARYLNPEPQRFDLLSAEITLDLASALHLGREKVLELSFEGQNLLDEDIRYPEYTSRQINTLAPLRGDRSFHATFTIGF